MTNDALRDFQTSLKHHREARGWTYAEMGKQLGLPPGSARQNAFELENSAKVPRLDRAAAVAHVFGMSLPAFLSVTQGLDNGGEGR